MSLPVIGIDPGVKGGLAVVDGDTLVDAWPLPTRLVDGRKGIDGARLADLVTAIGPVRMVVVERIPGLGPGIGKQSAMSVGWSLGTIHTVLAILQRPTSTVLPADWQKAASVLWPKGAKAAERKRAELDRARSLWPHRTWRAADSGMADAALMAWGWGRVGS